MWRGRSRRRTGWRWWRMERRGGGGDRGVAAAVPVRDVAADGIVRGGAASGADVRGDGPAGDVYPVGARRAGGGARHGPPGRAQTGPPPGAGVWGAGGRLVPGGR